MEKEDKRTHNMFTFISKCIFVNIIRLLTAIIISDLSIANNCGEKRMGCRNFEPVRGP